MPVTVFPFDSKQKVFTTRESINLLLVLFNAYIVSQSTQLIGEVRPYVSPPDGRPKLPMIRTIAKVEEFGNILFLMEQDPRVVAIFHHPDLDIGIVSDKPSRVIWALMTSEEAAKRYMGMPT
jgi:hypothetical protein